MGFEEFQRHQKELKEEERQKKQEATAGLNTYKGGEHVIKHAKALTDIRRNTLERKESAVRNNHHFRGLAQASPVKANTSLSPTCSFVVEENDNEKEEEGEPFVADVSLYSHDDDDDDAAADHDRVVPALETPEKGFAADRIAQTEARRDAAEQVALEVAAAVEADKQEAAEKMAALLLQEEKEAQEQTARRELLEEEIAATKEAEKIAAKEAEQKKRIAQEQAARASERDAQVLEAARIAQAEKDAKKAAWAKAKMAEDLARAEEEEEERAAAKESNDTTATTTIDKDAIDALANQWSQAAVIESSETTQQQSGNNRPRTKHGCRIELDFTFGLFFPSTEPIPEWDVCTQAAAGIVPNKIRTGKAPVSYDPEFPPVVKTIAKDDAFVPSEKGEIGMFRYVVRGKIPVFLEKKKEKKSETGDAPTIRKRNPKTKSTFVPVLQQVVEKATIVENEQGDQWKKVREGKPVKWEEIVEKSPACPSAVQ